MIASAVAVVAVSVAAIVAAIIAVANGKARATRG